MTETAICEFCGEPMPQGEEMFKYHGYSGPCPKPPKPLASPSDWAKAKAFNIITRHRDCFLHDNPPDGLVADIAVGFDEARKFGREE